MIVGFIPRDQRPVLLTVCADNVMSGVPAQLRRRVRPDLAFAVGIVRQSDREVGGRGIDLVARRLAAENEDILGHADAVGEIEAMLLMLGMDDKIARLSGQR
ncbi:MAG: hypothetical protein ACREQ5_28125, partial [Candidatus Dormibacteria bacterium]